MEFCFSWPLKEQPLSYWGTAASKWTSFPYKAVPVTQATLPSNGAGLGTTSCLPLCNPMTVAHQAPLSMGFSRQE